VSGGTNPPPAPPPPPGPRTPPPPPGPKKAGAERLYSVAEVAELWSVSTDSVYRLIAKGLLGSTQVGMGRAKTRVSESAMAAFIASRSTAARRRAA